MTKKCFGLLSLFVPILISSITENALAENTRFQAMDADSNSVLNLQEFLDANSNMSEQAFGIIDSNADGNISLDEWSNFLNRHSTPDGFRMGETTTTNLPVKDGPDMPTMPNLPEGHVPISPNTPMPGVVKNMGDLPILSAPQAGQTNMVNTPQAPAVPTVNTPTVNAPSVEQNSSDLPLLSAPKSK